MESFGPSPYATDPEKKSLGNDLLSQRAAPLVPSALAGLTAGFGMGPGVPPPLLSPRDFSSLYILLSQLNTTKTPSSPHHALSPRPLVRVSLTHCCAYTSRLSNRYSPGGLTWFLTSGGYHLRASFPLRCFQRLSLPDIATQRCSWRNNWHTRGLSIPVLSY